MSDAPNFLADLGPFYPGRVIRDRWGLFEGVWGMDPAREPDKRWYHLPVRTLAPTFGGARGADSVLKMWFNLSSKENTHMQYAVKYGNPAVASSEQYMPSVDPRGTPIWPASLAKAYHFATITEAVAALGQYLQSFPLVPAHRMTIVGVEKKGSPMAYLYGWNNLVEGAEVWWALVYRGTNFRVSEEPTVATREHPRRPGSMLWERIDTAVPMLFRSNAAAVERATQNAIALGRTYKDIAVEPVSIRPGKTTYMEVNL